MPAEPSPAAAPTAVSARPRDRPPSRRRPRRLGRFEDLIALADANRDILLRTALERDIHLVRFEEGRIEFRLAPGGRPSLATDLSAAIERWTGRRWAVALSKEEGAPTLDAAARAATETRRENAAADPFVREVLTRFPGAEIVDVRETASEALPAGEAEILGEGDAARLDDVEPTMPEAPAGTRVARRRLRTQIRSDDETERDPHARPDGHHEAGSGHAG